jgi:hypothetical protein
MSSLSTLSRVPLAARRKMALMLGLFCALFLAIGGVSLTGQGQAAEFFFASLAFVLAAALGFFAWGLYRSVQIDQAELALDAAVQETLVRAGRPGQLCDCGHDHDPNELHVTDAECSHDGTGTACAHDCQTCVMRGLPRAGR